MSELSNAFETIWDGQLGCYDADTFTINGAGPYACDAGELQKFNELVMGGMIDEPTAVVAVKRSLLASDPVLQQTVVYRSKNFKVNRIRSSPDNTVLILELEPKK